MRSRWTVRLLALLAVLAWLAIGGLGGPTVGKLSEVQENGNAAFLPATAESTKVSERLGDFTDTEALPVMVVMEKSARLERADLAAVQELAAKVPQTPIDLGDGQSRTIGDYLVGTPAAIPSEDGTAALMIVNLDAGRASETVGEGTPLQASVEALRELDDTLKPNGIESQVTGPGGIVADLVGAFAGIDGILLLTALAVVFVILLVVYRSPILPIAVLVTAVFGLAVAALVVYPLAKGGHIGLSGQSQGILSILVVGAATDYALLLVSRYREELHDTESTWEAMKTAWKASVEPIVASGATVILGLLCLLLSDLGSTSGLGPVGALGIAGALLAALTFLPAVLLLFGRAIFWPAIPRVDHVHREDTLGTRSVWGRVARMVGEHPRRTWVITLAALLAAAAFLPTFKDAGVTEGDTFLNTPESVTGQEALAKHFDAGSGSPVQIIAPADKADAVVARLKDEADISSPMIGLNPGRPSEPVDGRQVITATLEKPADSVEADQVISRLRADLDSVSEDVLVGGSTAANLDTRTASQRDLKVIIPAILAVVFLVLCLLLRSIVAPIVLIVANVISFAATLGIAALLFNHVWDFPGSDPATPLYGFVFLVALGIDYSIFLMTRVREESMRRGTREGTLIGLAVTGGVITSAGIVLAATFSALTVLPLLFMVQIAFIVAFGVLLDTLVVRSLLVPALAVDLGDRIWWPSRLRRPKHAD
ncbi:MMPL family transporter [Actinomycetota bacterium]